MQFVVILMENLLKTLQFADREESYNELEIMQRNLLMNGVFWVVTPCGSCKNRRFGGTWRLLHQGDKNR
jgi:hypothetical protein